MARTLEALKNLGLRGFLIHKTSARFPSRPARLRSRYATHAVLCRPGTSDRAVFNQIFVTREYQCIDEIRDAKFVIDAGANIGCSSAYFLSRFPHAKVIAIEPDPGNFAVLRDNLAPYGGRVEAINTALWSHRCELVLDETPFGDAREWAQHVRECRAGERPQCTAIDIRSLLDSSPFEAIDLLKVDIEGAEGVVFGPGSETWLDLVRNIVIELHGPENEAIFRRAIDDRPFEVSHHAELTVCKEISGRRPARANHRPSPSGFLG